jgi:molybdate transport system permease protein
MDWQSLTLSLKLAVSTVLVLLPIGVFVGRWLASSGFLVKSLVQSFVVLPLVLPPTVLGYYLLSIFTESSRIYP